ncbi:uncharacterized protein FA14DRAFT_162427 [Meira miltonrushii]|uniref:RNase III domain-containing protein n=1 Tax=Meira miltonrushii TaxID=1280837 RepID=A0A316V3X2_9BASI|nr:uncharacterized protein FA14DRAFT_162427 [Meira miltonrushii]PWN32230.1 hypothetical protein FA14DRAFT_162427 [Meira miltonrushii]
MIVTGRSAAKQALKNGLATAGRIHGTSQNVASSSIASSSRSTQVVLAHSFHTSPSQSSPSASSPRDIARSSNRRATYGSESSTVPRFNVRMTPAAAKDTQSVQRWLSEAFPTLTLPDDVALQMITHESWDQGVLAGHNRRLAFLGRRAMKFYLNLFLAQHPGNEHLLKTEKVDTLLQTSIIGDYVGRALKLGEVMRWTPAVNDGQKGAKETGLFKIRGVTVEALVGAIYHQHGAQAAKSFFASRVLPELRTLSEEDRERLKDVIAAEGAQGEAYLQAKAVPTESVAADSELTSDAHSTTTSATPTRPARRRSVSGSGTAFALDEETSTSARAEAHRTV